jgi:hypothetical protein
MDKFIEEKGYAKELEAFEEMMEKEMEEAEKLKMMKEEQDPFSQFDNRIKERFSFLKQNIEKKASEKINKTNTSDSPSDIV